MKVTTSQILSSRVYVISTKSYSGKQVDMFDRLWNKDLDCADIVGTPSGDFVTSTGESYVDVSKRLLRVYLEIPDGVWPWVNAKEFASLYSRYLYSEYFFASPESKQDFRRQVLETISSKWNVHYPSVDTMIATMSALRQFVVDQSVVIVNVSYQPHTSYDRSQISQTTIDSLSNMLAVTLTDKE